MRRWKLKNLSIALDLRAFGWQLETAVIPFRWATFAFRTDGLMHQPGEWQLFAGPFHVWTMKGNRFEFGFDLRIDQNSFHSGPLVPKKVKPVAK